MKMKVVSLQKLRTLNWMKQTLLVFFVCLVTQLPLTQCLTCGPDYEAVCTLYEVKTFRDDSCSDVLAQKIFGYETGTTDLELIKGCHVIGDQSFKF